MALEKLFSVKRTRSPFSSRALMCVAFRFFSCYSNRKPTTARSDRSTTVTSCVRCSIINHYVMNRVFVSGDKVGGEEGTISFVLVASSALRVEVHGMSGGRALIIPDCYSQARIQPTPALTSSYPRCTRTHGSRRDIFGLHVDRDEINLFPKVNREKI
jgi:hypothetical protein